MSSTSMSMTSTSTTATSSTTPSANVCSVTAYSAVSAAVASCTAITLNNVAVPGGNTLTLSKLLPNTVVTFAGTTTFGYYNWTGDLIDITGVNITVQGAPGHIIDGNGQSWWDGIGKPQTPAKQQFP